MQPVYGLCIGQIGRACEVNNDLCLCGRDRLEAYYIVCLSDRNGMIELKLHCMPQLQKSEQINVNMKCEPYIH